jgi:F420H(2)-dependent quinone reductase
MNSGKLTKRAVGRVNTWMTAARSSQGWIGRALRRNLTIVTYTGRRSGKTFSTPVGYKRAGDVVTIGVRIPNAKNWWRNFLDEQRPLSLELDGVNRTGQALSRRDDKGRVTVTVQLDA